MRGRPRGPRRREEAPQLQSPAAAQKDPGGSRGSAGQEGSATDGARVSSLHPEKRVRVEKVEEVRQPSSIKAPAVPHFGLPFQPQLQENHHVEVCPFSFEERDRERRSLKEKKLEEKRNEEVPHFKAQPLPAFDTVLLPEKKRLEPTKPEPFKLLLDERGAAKSSRTEQMAKEEQKPRAPVVVEAFALSTERRALERQEFERLANDKETLRMLMEEQQRQEVEQREKDDVTKMRSDQ
ncbi:hypothetical protein KUCAC02_011859, partial [Chaenocephalus aceratus]